MAFPSEVDNRTTYNLVRCITGTLCAFLALVSPALAQTPPEKSDAPSVAATPALATPDAPIELPDTPAGRALKSFLASLAKPDAPMTEQQFTPEFIKAVPLKQIEKLTADLRAANGEMIVRSIEPGATDTKLTVIARGTKSRKSFRIPISTDDKGVINGLFIAPVPTADTPPLKSWEDLDARLKPLAETVSFAAYSVTFPPASGGTDQVPPPAVVAIHELNADAPLAIGSTFKLYVLGALAEKIGRGETTWDTELAIDEKLKSLPSGVMQNEKDGAKFPIKYFALKMISISDNTATDHLLYFVGREKVEDFFRRLNSTPEKSLPFLGTREVFTIKLAADRTLGDRYAKATLDERRAMLMPPKAGAAENDKGGEIYTTQPSLALASFWQKPILIDQVEWFMSTNDACRAMIELKRLALSPEGTLLPLQEVLGANPGVPLDKKIWKRFFYKGGSEPGVLNLTWLLERDDGKIFALSITLNDTRKGIKEDDAIGLAQRAVELLAREDRK